MAFKKYNDEVQSVTTPVCLHMRTKAMIVTGDRQSVEHLDASHSQHCWCNLTQHVKGPDQKDVDRRDCAPGRECFRECP
jgi:hypothetical protein